MYRVCLLLSCVVACVSAFSSSGSITSNSISSSSSSSTELNAENSNRRQILKSIMGVAAVSISSASVAQAVDDDLTRGGVPLTPFNGLAFQYRGNSNGGLDASTLNEPSISYTDFLIRLDANEVEFVEFMAPNGDAAYATFKPKVGADGVLETKEAPIRIGEGYPIEDPEGWSSPAFVVKSVAKKGVPYKFTVPLLAKYRSKSV
jgi:hypothetical protein